jgi:hypothetical protein
VPSYVRGSDVCYPTEDTKWLVFLVVSRLGLEPRALALKV